MPKNKLITAGFSFLIPHLILVAVLGMLLLQSGETLTTHDLFTKVHAKGSYLFGPKYTSRIYKFKVEGTKFIHPEIIAIGSSRMNQWRSAMFKPYRFYNAANATFSPGADQQFLKDIGLPKPKVVMFSLDYFDLSDNWAPENLYSLEDVSFGSPLFLKVLEGMVTKFEPPPLSLAVNDPIYSIPAVGLNAANRGDGFRYDGSYQYGMQLKAYKETGQWLSADNLKREVSRVTTGERPFVFSNHFDADRIKDLKEFIAYAKKNGITLIAIMPPIHPDFLHVLRRSPNHNAWRTFNSPAFGNWLKDQGIIYFNFSDIQSFGGKSEEFVDGLHMSETGYSRMFLTMMKDRQVQSIFTKISVDTVKSKLSASYPLEVYKNEF